MTGGGISNYGVEPQTVSFYTTGFILAATGALASSYLLQGNTHHNSRLVSRSLIVLSVLYILVHHQHLSISAKSGVELYSPGYQHDTLLLYDWFGHVFDI